MTSAVPSVVDRLALSLPVEVPPAGTMQGHSRSQHDRDRPLTQERGHEAGERRAHDQRHPYPIERSKHDSNVGEPAVCHNGTDAPAGRRLWLAVTSVLALAVLASCGSPPPTHEPWGASVAPADVLDGHGYSASLELGDAQVKLTATGDQTVLRSTEGDTTLVHIETTAGSRGFQRIGGGPWTPVDAAAPTWPTALLVPSFADLLVAAAAAQPEGDEDALYRFTASGVNLAEFGLGSNLFLTYWLSPEGRVVRWTLGTVPETATVTWQIRPIETEDLDDLPSPP